MPWVRRSLRTVPLGWAPRASQSRMRSSSSTIVDGFVWALYCPTVSMTRPSRGERWSATTTRQMGFLWDPILVRRRRTAIRRTRLACAPHQRSQIRHPPLRHLPHHLAHLLELLDQLLDRLDVGSRAPSDPQPARAVDQLGMPPLLRRHRQDDGLDLVELPLVDLDPPQLLAHPRDHPEQRLERAEAPDLPQLVQEVVEPELLLAELALELRRLLLVGD